jgi:hypothetical protein
MRERDERSCASKAELLKTSPAVSCVGDANRTLTYVSMLRVGLRVEAWETFPRFVRPSTSKGRGEAGERQSPMETRYVAKRPPHSGE